MLLCVGLLSFALASPVADVGATPSSWSIVKVRHADAPTSANVLTAVSCTSPTFCIAVGYVRSDDMYQPLIEAWDGSRWIIADAPDPGQEDSLTGVSCVSPASCMAVGSEVPTPGGTDQPLAESWNGTTWSAMATPSPSADGDVLNAVSCIDSICIAVGSQYDASTNLNSTLVESWDGSTWSVVPSPTPSAQTADTLLELTGVSCGSPTSCQAVGYYQPPSTGSETLIESWSGTAWTIAPSPNPSKHGDQLSAVSCAGPTSCKAVGGEAVGRIVKTLIASWNGTAWKDSTSPTPSTKGSQLFGVSCAESTQCVAVGTNYGRTAGSTLVESFQGSGWSTTPSPTPPEKDDYPEMPLLNGVSCSAKESCMAAGDYYKAENGEGLTEEGS